MKKPTTRDRVKQMLIARPEFKDNDALLIAHYWNEEAKRKGIVLQNLTAIDLLKMISQGAFTSSETIRRDRCLLQEKEPTLRGQKYFARKGKIKQSVEGYLGYGRK